MVVAPVVYIALGFFAGVASVFVYIFASAAEAAKSSKKDAGK